METKQTWLADASAVTAPVRTDKRNGFRLLELHNTDATAENAAALAQALAGTLADTRPDMVMLCGDVTMGADSAEALHGILNVLLAPVFERKLPWAFVFGDDDRRGALSPEEQLPVYAALPGCLTVTGPACADGVGNFMVPVVCGDRLLCAVWGMETGAHVEEYEKQYHSPHRARMGTPMYTEHYLDGVRFNQTMWYWHASRELEAKCGGLVPGLIFCHVPLIEHAIISMNALDTGMRGYQRDNLATQTVCGGLFSAVMERGDVQGVYCGHTHHNHADACFTGRYAGVQLGLTGPFAADAPRYRLFTLEDGKFTEILSELDR